jgi:hypothetical protein
MGRRPNRSVVNAEMGELKMVGVEEGALLQQVVCMMFEGKRWIVNKRTNKQTKGEKR